MTNARTARSSREEKAAQLRAAAARSDARRRSTLVTAVVAVVLLVAVGTYAAVQHARRAASATAASSGPPRNLGPAGSIVVGDPGAPVTLVAYEDFQCPVCRQFETLNASRIDAWVRAGTVRVEYRPIAFLDANSTDDYSTRALNAVAALVDTHPQGFAALHARLFAQQPAEGGPGLTDQQLVDAAVAAGGNRDQISADVASRRFTAWTRQVTEASSKAGVTGTPTLIVNGKQLPDYLPATLTAAVDRASAAAR